MKIALFDMDGTLTPPREKMKYSMTVALSKLQDKGFKVGIVTGSSMNYITQQCSAMFDMSPVDYVEIDYFPCNGTKSYKYARGKVNPEMVYENHMIEALGKEKYNNIIYELASFQCRLRNSDYASKIPLTGNFIDCRGSMINWCPIGRNASRNERALWEELDNAHNIRINILENFFNIETFEGLTVKLGGSTSFDIFPEGWNKTFVLSNFADSDEIYFFGDRCEGQGNDRELYEELLSRANCHAFKTESPAHTLSLIEELLKRSSNE